MGKVVDVKVVIDKEGNATVSVEGIVGKKCLDVTRSLTDAIAKREDQEVKLCQEYYHAETGELRIGQAPDRIH